MQRKLKEAKEKRKDAKLNNVIINEKRDKKAAKYMVKELPYPYSNADQFDRAHINPIGREWNTADIFKRLITPAVTTKMGANIEPIKSFLGTDKKLQQQDKEDDGRNPEQHKKGAKNNNHNNNRQKKHAGGDAKPQKPKNLATIKKK